MKQYRATQKSNVTRWDFTGTLKEIAECLCANGKAEILVIEEGNEDYPEESRNPGIYYTPNCEAWDLERAGGIINDEQNSLGRTPMEEAVFALLSHDCTATTLEEVEA